MSRVPRISKSLSEIKSMLDSNIPIRVLYRWHGEEKWVGRIADCRDASDPYPITVTFANGTIYTFTADGYEYETHDHSYIILVDDAEDEVEECVVQPTHGDGKFESFMQLAADEGVSVEAAMKLYKNFKQ